MRGNSVRNLARDRNKTVGVIGLGNIGGGVAKSLVRSKGWDVLVWDTAKRARNRFEGRRRVSIVPPGEMAALAGIIIFIVPGTQQILTCLRGQNGILKRAHRGLTIYDFTTSDPTRTRRVAMRASKFGISYLDAGTSGGPYKAEPESSSLWSVGTRRHSNAPNMCSTVSASEYSMWGRAVQATPLSSYTTWSATPLH